MTTDSLHHSDFLQQIDAYLAGGLDPAERAAFEMHAAACEACAGVLEAARRSDQAIDQLFADVRPRADFEDRLIGRLRDLPRQGRQEREARSALFRFATGIAAVIVLGGLGYVVQTTIQSGSFPTFALYSSQGSAGGVVALRSPAPEQSLAPSASTASPASEDTPAVEFMAAQQEIESPEQMIQKTNARLREQMVEVPESAVDESVEPDYSKQQPQAGQMGWEHTEGSRAPGVTELADLENAQAQRPSVEPAPADMNFGQPVSRSGKATGPSAGAVEKKGSGPNDEQDTWVAPERTSSVATDGESLPYNDVMKFPEDWPDIRESRSEAETEDRDERIEGRPRVAQGPRSGTEQGAKPGQGRQENAPNGKNEGPPEELKPTPEKPPGSAPSPAPAAAENLQPATRKVIRNGEMSFEVDSFDSALMQITKIAQEEGGFVSTTDSEKLPNGKVSGTVIVRVVPDRLDTLVLKFRGLGDLKSSRIAAQDITKHYTDLASQLRASRAMEERLLEIIKTGKGSIKELLAAEKELGVWREKIEKLEGEIRYYDNLVSLSTLSITLMERELRTAAMLSESETVQMGIEAEDVEKARADAIAAIDAAKGRIVQSDLKRHAAGQYIAHIEAEVAPDAAGPLIDRLKQLGRIGRLEIQRRQTTPENAPPLANARVERNNTRLIISLYNVASIAPRETTTLTIASSDVADTFNTLRDAVHAASGRVLSTQLQEQDATNSSAQLDFEVRREDWAAVEAALRNAGQIMSRQVTRSADMENTVDSKIRLQVVFLDAAQLNPRETVTLQLAVSDVPEQFAKLAEVLREVDARVIDSRLNEAEQHRMNGTLVFDIRRASRAAVDKALAEAGDVVSRNVMRSNDTQNTLDDKVRLSVSITDADHLPPRETTTLGLESKDVDQSLNQIKSTALALGGRVVDSTLSKEKSGRVMGKIVVDVPLNKSMEMLTKASDEGRVQIRHDKRNEQVPVGGLTRARLDVTLANADLLVETDKTLGSSIRSALGTSIEGLLWSMQLIIVGLCLVLPWALLIWAGWRWFGRRKTKPAPNVAPPAA